MREHEKFQTFRPRLPEVYDAPAHDYLLLRAPRVGGATYIFVKYACPPTYTPRSLEGRAQRGPSARPTFSLSASHLNLSSDGESEITTQKF